MGAFDSIKKSKFGQILAKSQDFALAITIILVVIMMIIPIPTFILDAALALNLIISLLMVVSSVYIPNIVYVSSFPAILLLITILRLGLHVAASRQILSRGYAGKIIDTFGKYSAGGSYIIGGVIFIIITIVQFVVVVKGAERISEVSARFALDAMPGKQMSIEADMRAGTLNAKQAREKRSDVQKESQLYGSMDGALKFVKGDSIAGIIVAAVNILGGIAIGVLMHGLGVQDAAKKYLLLTIGEGLVFQVSALLVSVASGLIITKVSSEDGKEKKGLANDIIEQFFLFSTPLIISGVFLIFIGLVPGMPWYIFIPFGVILLYLGYKQSKKSTVTKETTGQAFKDIQETGHALIEGPSKGYSPIVPVILEAGELLSNIITNKVKQANNLDFMEQMIPKMRAALYNDTGIVFPGIHFNVFNASLPKNEFAILLNEIPNINIKLLENHIIVNETNETLDMYKIQYTKENNPLGLPSCWVNESSKSTLDNLSIKYWSIPEFVLLTLTLFYTKNSASFIGIQESKGLISFAEQEYPDLVKEVTRLLPLQKVSEIFKRLAAEEVSIKDARSIFEALIENAQSEKNPAILTEYIRAYMNKYITYKASRGKSSVPAYLIDPGTEDIIRSSIKETSDGSYLALNPEHGQQIIASAKKIISMSSSPQVIVTSMDIRRFVYKMLFTDFPKIMVISYQELLPNINIQPLGHISH